MSEGKETDSLKRKTGQNDVAGRGAQKKIRREDNGEETVTAATEEEVEEFFAILKRIHEAVDYFKNGNGDERSLTELENTDADMGYNRDNKDGVADVKENVGLDLNADPETDSDPL